MKCLAYLRFIYLVSFTSAFISFFNLLALEVLLITFIQRKMLQLLLQDLNNIDFIFNLTFSEIKASFIGVNLTFNSFGLILSLVIYFKAIKYSELYFMAIKRGFAIIEKKCFIMRLIMKNSFHQLDCSRISRFLFSIEQHNVNKKIRIKKKKIFFYYYNFSIS